MLWELCLVSEFRWMLYRRRLVNSQISKSQYEIPKIEYLQNSYNSILQTFSVHSLKALNNSNTFSNMTSTIKSIKKKKTEVSKSGFRCDSEVTCIASGRWKSLHDRKIQDRIYCKQLVLETAQLSQLDFAISLGGHVWNFPLLHPFPSSPLLLGEWSAG